MFTHWVAARIVLIILITKTEHILKFFTDTRIEQRKKMLERVSDDNVIKHSYLHFHTGFAWGGRIKLS